MQNYEEELFQILETSIRYCNSKNLALSGGLDSSIIAYLLRNKGINAIALSTKDFMGTDLAYSQIVAKKFDIPLEIKMPSVEEILTAIEETIKILKNFNDIEIRNSIVMYLIIKYLKNEGQSNIITGDGADELFAGYSFFLKKTEDEIKNDLNRILKIMHYPIKKIGDSLKFKVETPFLDETLINFSKSIPTSLKVNLHDGKKYGKLILRKIFENKLPTNIVWREKTPMQDGAGTTGLINLFNSIIPDKVFKSKAEKIILEDKVRMRTKESLHYYEIYRKYFDAPYKLHTSDNKCPNCNFMIKKFSKFCNMCGQFPI